jgi:hypothetical protein
LPSLPGRSLMMLLAGELGVVAAFGEGVEPGET